jgi:hypothetical protein
VQVRRLERGELPLLRPLIETYPFKPYRNYRVLSRSQQNAVMEAEIAATLESEDGIVLFGEGETEIALVMRQLPWDSRFFGVPMARVDYVLRALPDVRHGLDDVLTSFAGVCRAGGIWHVTARADVADTVAITALEDYGFRLVEALVTYVHRPKDPRPPEVRQMGQVRDFRPEDQDQIVAIARDSYRGFRGRFHLDPHLRADRSDALYVEWATQCCTGRMADKLIVTENRNGELLGFLAYRKRQPASNMGRATIYGGGLGACRQDAPGAYMGLIRELMVWAHDQGAVAEGQTQIQNFPTVRVYEAVTARYVRADYTFHAWFGPEEAQERQERRP